MDDPDWDADAALAAFKAEREADCKDLFGPNALIMASAPNTDGFPHICGRCNYFRSDRDNRHTGLCTICDMPMSWKDDDNDCPQFDAAFNKGQL